MTKKKRTSKSSKKSSPKSIPKPAPKVSWTPKLKMSVILAVCTVASFALSLVVFWPRFSVERDEILDPQKPFSSSFLVKNDGYGFCYPISYSVGFKDVVFFGGGGISNIGLSRPDEDIPALCPNKSSTISLERFLVAPPSSIKSAEIYIDLSYKPSWVPSFFERFLHDSFRFKVARKENGDYVWQKFF
jgi:hypothetical protein